MYFRRELCSGQQMQRTADSVALSNAESSTEQPNPEFKKFLGYFIRSGMDVMSCLYIGRKREIINESDFQKRYK
ncbi:four helix bundle protein [Algoriphagus resistens]|uniref:four helix bundle protein n=1 Tax=Algoriphagus resistens TaxID=1750590 RepID=UPI00373FDAB3